MPHDFSKMMLGCLLGGLALFTGARASAQSSTAAPLSWSTDFTYYLQYYDAGQKQWLQMNPTQQTYYFNRARCECDADQTNDTGSFRVAIQPGPNTGNKVQALLNQNLVGSGTVRLYAGSNIVNCLTPSAAAGGIALSGYCINLLNPDQDDAGVDGGMAVFAATRVWYSPPIPVAWLFNAVNYPVCNSTTSCDSTTTCATAAATVSIYFWGQTSSSQVPDMQDSLIPVNLVGQSAFVPDSVAVDGGNEALNVSWSWPNGHDASANPAFLGVQLFCVRGQNNQVFPTGTFSAAYMTSASLCPAAAPATAAGGGLAQLDPSYLCSGLLPTTATSHRITGLQNGIPYGVGVAAVDKFGNIGSVSDLVYASPIPSTEQGGGCDLAGGSGRPGALGGLAWFGMALLIALRKRSMTRR